MTAEKLVCRLGGERRCYGHGGGNMPPRRKSKEISHAYRIHVPRSGPAPCPAIRARGAPGAKGDASRGPAPAPAQGNAALLPRHRSPADERGRETERSGAPRLRLIMDPARVFS